MKFSTSSRFFKHMLSVKPGSCGHGLDVRILCFLALGAEEDHAAWLCLEAPAPLHQPGRDGMVHLRSLQRRKPCHACPLMGKALAKSASAASLRTTYANSPKQGSRIGRTGTYVQTSPRLLSCQASTSPSKLS